MRLMALNATGPTVSVRKVLDDFSVISFLILGNAFMSFLKSESSGKNCEQTKHVYDVLFFCGKLLSKNIRC